MRTISSRSEKMQRGKRYFAEPAIDTTAMRLISRAYEPDTDRFNLVSCPQQPGRA